MATRNKAFTSGKYAQQIVIGCDQSTGLFGERWMNGVIDELMIYGNELNKNEINISSGISQEDMMRVKYKYLDNPQIISSKSVTYTENRIIFDSYPASWQMEAQALKTIKKLYDAGINVYIPCVWYGDGARFDSSVAPSARYKGKVKPLENLIRIAHKYSIEVHPWITVVYRSDDILSEYYEPGTPPNAFEVHKKSSEILWSIL